MAYFRKPKTRGEQRANGAEDAKYGRRRDVPTAWDDIGRSDYANRNWKKYRKTKWKPAKKVKRENKGSS